ncbi:hypothetical protein SLA2020_461970 [Shorea laevis]
MDSSSFTLSQWEQEHLLEKLKVFKIQGRDKRSHQLLLIVGKDFPAPMVSSEALKKYLEEKIYPKIRGKPFSMVYVHTGVQRSRNFPGIWTLWSICDAIPINVKENLEAVYFLHPGLQSRLFVATFGPLLFSKGLYRKLQYVNRLEFLWHNVRSTEMEMPEFVYDHDKELENRPLMNYGLESDHPRPRIYSASSVDPPVSNSMSYSTRCIA